jgi:hypothetical protein
MEFPDHIHVQQIAKALWHGQAHGRAAIMVGAGLSLNAVPRRPSPNAMRFPTWSQLARRFVADLYPEASTTSAERAAAQNRANSTSGAMRVAEEYEAAHGRAALDSLMLSAIPDADFEPGPLHRLLLSLPWADVFTTNYDTLLERAASSLPHRRYDVVTSPEEIPGAARPRIVKLHGSFPSIRPFVITEEDFRTYPRRAAALVNMAQQAFVESTFCLIGFSGDDPNFLAWSGWARDTLGSGMRRIYLCGLLGLTPPQRKMLQDRHVMPVDLSPLFPVDRWTDVAERHAMALEWFLLALEGERPPDVFAWPSQAQFERTAPSSPDMPPRPDLAGGLGLAREARNSYAMPDDDGP